LVGDITANIPSLAHLANEQDNTASFRYTCDEGIGAITATLPRLSDLMREEEEDDTSQTGGISQSMAFAGMQNMVRLSPLFRSTTLNISVCFALLYFVYESFDFNNPWTTKPVEGPLEDSNGQP
jgi:hypothetical protein